MLLGGVYVYALAWPMRDTLRYQKEFVVGYFGAHVHAMLVGFRAF